MRKIFLLFCIVAMVSCDSEDDGTNLPPSDFEITISEITGTSAQLTWTEATDPEGLDVAYSISLDGNLVRDQLFETNLNLTELQGDTEYAVSITATDVGNNSSVSTTSFSTLENGAPTSFTVTMSELTETTASLSWTASADPEGTTVTYDIMLNGDIIEENLTATSINLTELNEVTEYVVLVIAKDEDGKTTEGSFSFITIENDAPTTFEISISEITEDSAQLSWTASIDPEGTLVTYKVTINGNTIGENLTETSIGITELANNTEYTVVVKATDEYGKSTETTDSFATLETNLPPASFTTSLNYVTDNEATISWTESVDPNEDNVTYDVYLDDNLVANDLEELSYTFHNLSPVTFYNVKVVSKDAEFTNESETSFETTSSPPSDFDVSIDNITTSGALIDWTDATDPDGDNVFYDVYLNGLEELGGWTNSIYAFSNLAPGTTYTIRIVARDSSGASTEKTVSFNTLPVDDTFAVTTVNIYEDTFFEGYVVVIGVTDSSAVESITIGDVVFSNFFTPSTGIINFNITQDQYDAFLASQQNSGVLTYDDDGVSMEIAFIYNIN
ncbi:MAG: fibronectin type III domain-containing protein [Flavobacteriaceae bacterium]